jgi:hypothetical protein
MKLNAYRKLICAREHQNDSDTKVARHIALQKIDSVDELYGAVFELIKI